MKSTILALAIVLSASAARAADWPLTLGIALANGADLYTTHQAIASGHGVEANPLMQSPTVRLGLKAGVTVVETTAVHALWTRGHKRAAVIVGLGLIAGNGYLAVHNMQIAAKR